MILWPQEGSKTQNSLTFYVLITKSRFSQNHVFWVTGTFFSGSTEVIDKIIFLPWRGNLELPLRPQTLQNCLILNSGGLSLFTSKRGVRSLAASGSLIHAFYFFLVLSVGKECAYKIKKESSESVQ